MSCLHHILHLWYNTFTNKCWHRNKYIATWTSRFLNLFLLILVMFLSVLPKVHKKNIFLYNIHLIFLLSSTVYIKTEYKLACYCDFKCRIYRVSLNLTFKYTGLSSTHIKSTKLGSARPNQGMQYRKVTRKTERENTASSSVIVNSFIVLLKKNPNGTRHNCTPTWN
jgi:hypothetical protein